MAGSWHTITAPARRALTTQAHYQGPRVTITEQIGPDAWRHTKTVLEKLGAVYVIGTSAFDFEPDQDACAMVAEALTAGRVMGAAASQGWVPTPVGLAEELVDWFGEVNPVPGRVLRVLEPSAGTGRLVAAVHRGLDIPWLHVTAVEPDERRARQIPTDGLPVTVRVERFEAFAVRALRDGDRFDVVVANPPFAVPGSSALWAEHVLLAWQLLAPGGRLAAIVPASVADRRRVGVRVVQAVRDLADEHGGTQPLGHDAFAESHVAVGTAVMWLDTPLTAGPVRPVLSPPYPWVFQAYSGDEPAVRVTRPYLTRGAGASMPVQVWADSWRGRDRVLRYRAACIICTRPVWGFDDGENDPRGALGDNSAAWSLDPYEYDCPAGMPVGLCAMCGNDGALYGRALAKAQGWWIQRPVERAAPAARKCWSGVVEGESAEQLMLPI